jgi:hypothetical protein
MDSDSSESSKQERTAVTQTTSHFRVSNSTVRSPEEDGLEIATLSD